MSSLDCQKGQLILLSSDGENVIHEPVNNILSVGSQSTTNNVCLSGLKNTAFSIGIDTFGRVSCILKFVANFFHLASKRNGEICFISFPVIFLILTVFFCSLSLHNDMACIVRYKYELHSVLKEQ